MFPICKFLSCVLNASVAFLLFATMALSWFSQYYRVISEYDILLHVILDTHFSVLFQFINQVDISVPNKQYLIDLF